MALVKCKECGKKISALAKACPSCGCPLGEQILLQGKFPGKKCINCQAAIPLQADYCTVCSAKQKSSTTNGTIKTKKGLSQKQKVWLMVAIGVVLVMALGRGLKEKPNLSAPQVISSPVKDMQSCNVPKKDGTYETERCDDLDELAKDWLFYRKEIIIAARKGDKAKADKRRASFQQINAWLSQYNDSDVSRAIAKYEK